MQKRKPRAIDLTGQRFSRLVVTGRAPNSTSSNHAPRWYCTCDCGKKTCTNSSDLRSGNTKSCGCYSHEIFQQMRYKHGGSRDGLYQTWSVIKQRCLNPKHTSFRNYGARGITICDEWCNDYLAFANYMGKRPSSNHSIERIDNSRGYEPGNVKWATHSEQQRNTRRNQLITHAGRTMCLRDWAREFGIHHTTLRYRIFTAKWPIEKALTK